MKHSVRMWFHGLGSAIIGGFANAITVMIIDPLKFNMQDGWYNVLTAAIMSGLVSASFYLKQSPLPDEEGNTDSPQLPPAK